MPPEAHPCELYLALNEIKHRRTRDKHPWTNGFDERFHRTAFHGFFREAFRMRFSEAVEPVQDDFDACLRYDNEKRPHPRYRNYGVRPLDTVSQSPALPNVCVA